jgi:hypothetical protein
MLRSGVTVLVALCLLLAPVSAAEAQNGDVGRAEEVSGSVTRQRGGTAVSDPRQGLQAIPGT